MVYRRFVLVILGLSLCMFSQVYADALTGVTIDSSSGFHASYPATNMVDGNDEANNMGWGNVAGAWAIFDLGDGGQTFSKVRISVPSYGGSGTSLNPTAATMEFSDDLTTWSSPVAWNAPPLDSYSGYTKDYAECAMPEAVTTQYVRFNYTTLGRIREFWFIDSPQLSVWEMAQGATYSVLYPAINTADGNAATFGVNGNGIVYDRGFSGPVQGFKMQARAYADLNPTAGSLWVSDSPDSGFAKVGDWTLPGLAVSEWGTVDLGAGAAITGRYVKIADMTGPSTQWAEIVFDDPDIVPYPVSRGKRIFAVNGDEIVHVTWVTPNLYQFFERTGDGSAHVVLDMLFEEDVRIVKIVNRLTATSYAIGSAKIWVAPDEAAAGFVRTDISSYTEKIYDGPFLPASNAGGKEREADVMPDVQKRYILIQVVSNLLHQLPLNGHAQVYDVSFAGSSTVETCDDVIGLDLTLDGDVHEDCYVNILDLSTLTARWLDCTEPGGDGCLQTPGSIPTYTIEKAPAGGITVDGDLGDWPADSEWIWLDKLYSGDDPWDVEEAKFSLRWDDDPNSKIYLAVIVNDPDHTFVDEPTAYDTHDMIEIYSQGDAAGGTGWGAGGTENFDVAQQYLVGSNVAANGHWAVWADLVTDIDPDAGFEYFVVVSGDLIIYEIGLVPFDNYGGISGTTVVTAIVPGETIVGFDVIADTYHSGGFSMLAENTYSGKYWDADQFQQYELVDTLPQQYCGDWGYLDEDINRDCEINLEDFVYLADQWLLCNDPEDGSCIPW